MMTLLLVLALVAPSRDDLEARAAAIKPTPRELTWLGIPWVLDLSEARKLARGERRPIFLWAAGDDPLERC
jgi:hypothetical protein